MKQKEVMELLRQAAAPNCSEWRINQIHCLLNYAIGPNQDSIRVLIGEVYVSTLKNRPWLLPTLFPLFAAACGDSGDYLVAKVDWSQF